MTKSIKCQVSIDMNLHPSFSLQIKPFRTPGILMLVLSPNHGAHYGPRGCSSTSPDRGDTLHHWWGNLRTASTDRSSVYARDYYWQEQLHSLIHSLPIWPLYLLIQPLQKLCLALFLPFGQCTHSRKHRILFLYSSNVVCLMEPHMRSTETWFHYKLVSFPIWWPRMLSFAQSLLKSTDNVFGGTVME